MTEVFISLQKIGGGYSILQSMSTCAPPNVILHSKIGCRKVKICQFSSGNVLSWLSIIANFGVASKRRSNAVHRHKRV
jgi:hypothetical protein